MLEHNEAKQRKIGIAFSYANLAFSVLVIIVYTPLMLRYLGPSEYGIYTMASALVGYLGMLDLGLGITLVKFSAMYRALGEPEMEARLRGVFLVIYSALGAVVLVGGLAIYSQLGLVFGEGLTGYELSRLRIVFLIMTVNLAVSFPLGVFSSAVTSYERFAVGNGLELLKTVSTYGAMLVLLLLGGKSVSLSMATAVFAIAAKLFLLYYCLGRMKVKFRLGRLERGAVGEIVYYSFFIFLNIVIDQMYQNTSRVILGAVCGTLAVTTYNVSMQFHSLLTRLSTAVSSVYLPHITTLVVRDGEDRTALSRQFIAVGRFQFILLSFAMSGFICFGRSFIRLWAGPEYGMAYFIALVVMIPAMIPLTQNLGILILQAENRHAFRSVVYFGLAVLNVAVGIPLSRMWEGLGAAIAMALSCVLGQILTMNLYYARAIGLDIPGYWREVGKIGAVTAAVCLAGTMLAGLFKVDSWVSLLIGAAVYAAAYAAVAWRYILNRDERAQVAGWIRKAGRR